MKKVYKWVLGIFIFLVLFFFIYGISFLGFFSKPSGDTIVYYKDGERVTSVSGELCSSFYGSDTCERYGAERYYFTAEFESSHPRIHYGKCEQEFEERIGKKLEGYCILVDVLINKLEGEISEYSCDCWSN